MRVLVAGATSTLGRATVDELGRRGHEVLALTRSEEAARELSGRGLTALVGDVLDASSIASVLDRTRPDAVVSLLIKLPRNGPRRYRDYRDSRALWDIGVPNLLAAAEASGVSRIVGESVLFAYGYLDHGEKHLTEDSPLAEGRTPAQREVLDSLRGMEERVRVAGGVVLRYGLFRGQAVPSEAYLAKVLKLRLPVLPGGGRSVLSFVALDDAARATAAALERGRPGATYNVCDDEPAEFGVYVRAVATRHGLPRPRSVPLRLAGLVMPYIAMILDGVRIPMANGAAHRDLGWRPTSTVT